MHELDQQYEVDCISKVSNGDLSSSSLPFSYFCIPDFRYHEFFIRAVPLFNCASKVLKVLNFLHLILHLP